MAQLMPLSLASGKSRLVLPFWYWPTRVVPEKGPLNECVCWREAWSSFQRRGEAYWKERYVIRKEDDVDE